MEARFPMTFFLCVIAGSVFAKHRLRRKNEEMEAQIAKISVIDEDAGTAVSILKKVTHPQGADTLT